jgi:hypothetical protein
VSRAALVLLALLAAALPGAAWASPQEHGRWRRPLARAETVGAFTFDAATPYAPGARRGIDLRASPGDPVLAACGGTVEFAGRMPGRRALGVTLACGRLRATELGLASVAVRRGARVRAGAPLGRLARPGVLRLGARHAGARHGYVDPASLLAGPPPATAPPAALPVPRRVPAPLVPRRAAPPPAAGTTTGLPWPAWTALGLLTAGAAGGAATTGRRRRDARARTHAAHRYR